MQSQQGNNMPCVNSSNSNNDNDNGMPTSPIPNAHSFASIQENVSPSLVSLDSYGNFPTGSDSPSMAVSSSSSSSYNGVAVAKTTSGANHHHHHQQHCNNNHGSSNNIKNSTIAIAIEKPQDDLDLLLQHQDFSLLVTLAVKVKQARALTAAACSSNNNGHYQNKRQANSALDPADVIACVSRLQDQLLSCSAGPNSNNCNNNNNNKANSASANSCRHVIPRGVFPITDSIMDDSLETLQNEMDRCNRCLKQEGYNSYSYGATNTANGATSNAMPTGTASSDSVASKKGPKKRGRANEAIAVKYSKWQTDILMNWMIENKDQPFPDQDEIKKLMKLTGLSQSQVVNWTTNVRKRNRKATVAGGKKPHHFIDFLFLAQDREAKEKRQYEQEQPSKVQSNGVHVAPTPYAPLSYHQQHQQKQHRHQQRHRQPEQQRHQQESYPSPKQLQSSSHYAPSEQQYKQESYPSPKQLQSSSHYAPPEQLQSSSVYAPPEQQYKQEAYPSPKQLQSSSHYAPPELPRFPTHPGAAVYHYNRHDDASYTRQNTWEPAPFVDMTGGHLEPLPMINMPDPELLDDFSNFWLEDEHNHNHGNITSGGGRFNSNSDADLVDVLEDATVRDFMMTQQRQQHYTAVVQPLLPSVTDDQDADAMPDYPRSNKRRRTMSVDLMGELKDEDINIKDWAAGLKDEDIDDWAAELGLADVLEV